MKISSCYSSSKSFFKKLTAFIISVCLAASFVPAASAETLTDNISSDESVVQTVQDGESTTKATESTTQATESTTQATESTTQATESTTQATESTTQATESTTQATESTTQATESTTQATESTTQATESTTQATKDSYNQASDVKDDGNGFGMAQSDGGVLFIGTALIPKTDNSIATVKFIYSSSINLNDKSLALINKELAACGVSIPGGMIYVSGSDIVSDSSLMTTTSERRAVFAVGSPDSPVVLKAYPAYGSVEESFEMLYRGYIFSINGYSSLRSVLEGREEVTLSEDGQTASTSIVMSEDYVEKIIHGRRIRILMINSEMTYYFRAPKLTFVKDQDYNASDSDIVYHYPTHPTTDPEDTLTTEASRPTTTASDPFFDDNTTEPATTTSDTTTATETTATTKSTTMNSTTEGTDDFWDDDTTQPTIPTKATTSPDNYTDSTTENTYPDHGTDPSRLIPKAQPITPIPTQSTIDDYTTTSTTESTTAPTTDSTTERTEKPTQGITLPTTTQPTRDDPIIDPFVPREQHEVGEAFVNTRRLPLNIRSGPGLNYMVVNLLPKGTHLMVLDTSNPDWYMVRTKNNTVGYAYSYYIKFVE